MSADLGKIVGSGVRENESVPLIVWSGDGEVVGGDDGQKRIE